MKVEHPKLRKISRRFWGTVFTIVIAMAVLIQLGRQAFPLLKDYQDEITTYFGENIGVQIEVEEMDATWAGLRPRITVNKAHVLTPEGVSIFKVNNATLELSIVNSLTQGRPYWRTLAFSGLEATMSQDEDGGWRIDGMPDFQGSSSSKSGSFDDPYDPFLMGRRVKIEDAIFNLNFHNGDSTQVLFPNISLENDRDFRRIQASVGVGEEDKAFSLTVEGHGDPREPNFIANGYMEFRDFPTQRVLDVLAIKSIETDAHKLNLKLWFRGDAGKGTTFRGELLANGGISMPGRDVNLPSSITAKINGKARESDGWQLTLQNVQAAWSEKQSPEIDFALFGDFRGLKGVKVQEIDLEAWLDLVLYTGLNNPQAEKILRTINPKGAVKNLNLELTSKEEGYFLATARVENGSSEAFKGAPALGNVNGFLSTSLLNGTFDVAVDNGFTLDLPKVYYDPLYFEQAKGQITWEVDIEKKRTYINSGLLTVTNPEEEGKGYLHLSLPFKKEYGEQWMTLAIGIENTLARNHKKYVPKTIPKHLYSWLGTSIKEGRVTNARFLYHGSVDKGPKTPPTIQLYGEVHDGNLVFDPNWPELTGVSGRLTLENNSLDVEIDKAELMGNSVYDAAIKLVKDPSIQGQALSIKGSLATDAESAMELLRNSPVKKHIGSTFDQWEVSGGVGAKVELLVPLNAESKGFSHKIDVEFAKANLKIPELDLDIKQIAGDLHYTTHEGMFSDRLSGKIWGRNFMSSIESPKNESGGFDTSISFSGTVGMEDMYRWTKRPELKFAEGASALLGNIMIPGQKDVRPLEIKVSSLLEGVTIDLPEPFGKAKESSRNFSSLIRFHDDGEEYRFTMDETLSLSLFNERQGDLSANIKINNFNPEKTTETPIERTGRFDITGKIGHFDLEVWNEIKDRYFDYAVSTESSSEGESSIPAKFAVSIDKFLLGTFEIEDLEVEGQRRSPFWDLDIVSELMAGKVVVPENDSPIALNLDYLRLPEESAEGESVEPGPDELRASVLADIDLNRAVPLDVSVDQFSLGEAYYGKWDFKVRPFDEGIKVQDIRAEVKGMRLGSREKGAEFVWRKTDESQSSKFVGEITAKNLADVFEAWGQEKLLESEYAAISIDAGWVGAPDQVTLKTIKGVVGLNIQRGSFNRGAGSDENALLRLLALFNFDTILRRLRLDFSDLAAQGFAYDKMYGRLNFEGGLMYLTEPLIVESSSSYVQSAGTVDMINETLDSEMVVTLPVASNVAVATAVVVGLPAALGVYVMSKLFKKQVDRASSLNINVTGKWEDPKIKVKKIFDINAASRRGKEIEKQNQEQTEAAATP